MIGRTGGSDSLRANLRVAYQVHRKSVAWTEPLVVKRAGRAQNRGISRESEAVQRYETWTHAVEMPKLTMISTIK